MLHHQGTWKHKRGKMSKHYRADVVRLLKRGWSSQAIGNHFGVSGGCVLEYLHKQGLMNTYNANGSIKFWATENPREHAPLGVTSVATERLYKAYVHMMTGK